MLGVVGALACGIGQAHAADAAKAAGKTQVAPPKVPTAVSPSALKASPASEPRAPSAAPETRIPESPPDARGGDTPSKPPTPAKVGKPAPASPKASAIPGRPEPTRSPAPAPVKQAAKPATSGRGKTAAHVAPSRQSDPRGRRAVAGGPTFDEASLGVESPELGALHDAERELFPPAMPSLGAPWPSSVASPMGIEGQPSRPHASGIVPNLPSEGPPHEVGRDLSWLEGLEMPELPVRWDSRLVRYLEFWKSDPRGHAMFAHWLKRSGRYRDTIKKTFAKRGVPEDLVWLAMVESGFEPQARSPVGAMGMWQFMPETGRIYGLSQDRWADQRIHVQSATEAAADFLLDLYRRFGTWDLAMASYNMGYGGITQVVKKYNSNDYWALAKLEGSLPWETTLYVPKILSCAIVSKNLAKFGFSGVEVDPPTSADEVRVHAGTALTAVAQAAGVKPKEIELLNPELRAQRTPPGDPSSMYVVRVPSGKGPTCADKLAKVSGKGESADRYVVKVGESLSDIAESHRVPTQRLVDLNAIAPGEVLHGGTVLLVPAADEVETPKVDPQKLGEPAAKNERPVVIVPADVYVYPDRTRVFYKVKAGDLAPRLADTFGVTLDELRRWNTLDLRARLLEGMTLQVFVKDPKKLADARVLGEGEVRTIVSGSEEFFAHFEEKGRKRIVVQAKAGETLEVIGKRHGVTAKLMERINRRGKSEPLRDGENIVLYVPPGDGAHPGELGEKPEASPLPAP